MLLKTKFLVCLIVLWLLCFSGLSIYGDDHAKPCHFSIVYDNKEYLGNGVTNYFWGISGFDTTNEECWNSLAELYYNIVPDTLTKTQNTYFLLVNDSIDQEINKVKELQSPGFEKARVIALHQYGEGIDSTRVVYYPLK